MHMMTWHIKVFKTPEVLQLFHYLAILCKHLFYFQARVEQTDPFHILHLLVLTMMLDRRQAVLDCPVIHESMCPAGYPKTHALLVPQA